MKVKQTQKEKSNISSDWSKCIALNVVIWLGIILKLIYWHSTKVLQSKHVSNTASILVTKSQRITKKYAQPHSLQYCCLMFTINRQKVKPGWATELQGHTIIQYTTAHITANIKPPCNWKYNWFDTITTGQMDWGYIYCITVPYLPV